MKKTLLIVFLTIITNFAIGQTVNFQWAKQHSGSSNEISSSITTDAAGNVYTTGYFISTVDFDPSASVYTITGNNEPYISKLDANGNFVWAKKIDAIGGAGNEVEVDGNGNVYLLGTFQATVDLDPGAGTYSANTNGQKDIFVIKLDNSGNFIWGKTWGGALNDDGNSIAIDAAGNVYTTGGFKGVVDFDPGLSVVNFTTTGLLNIFISKLNAAGNFVWAKQFESTTGGGTGLSITLDNSGNIYTSGQFSSTFDFDPNVAVYNLSCTISGGGDGFVSKLDPNGSFLWAKQLEQSTYTNLGITPNAIQVDAASNVYTAGKFSIYVDFDPSAATYTLGSTGGYDVFISKLDASGNFVWAKQFGGPNSDETKGMALDLIGNIFITGAFISSADFDPSTSTYSLASLGVSDAFIEKLDAGGNFVWVKQLGGGFNNTGGTSIYVDAANNIYSTGGFGNFADFDPGPSVVNLVSAGNSDIYIHKMSQCYTPTTPVNTTPTVNLTICEANAAILMASGSGTISWYTTPSAGTALGSGTLFTTPILSAGSYTYYAEAITCTNSISRAAITVSVMVCTGVKSANRIESLISVYPNPSNGVFTVDVSATTIINITDMLGKIVYEETLQAGKHSINLTDFTNCSFVLKAESNGKVNVVKLVKE